MHTEESEKSNLEVPDLRVTGSNPMSKKHRKFFIALWLVTAALLPVASAQESKNNKPEQATKVINLWPGVAPGPSNGSSRKPLLAHRAWRQLSTSVHRR
jgi:hypothetical protein